MKNILRKILLDNKSIKWSIIRYAATTSIFIVLELTLRTIMDISGEFYSTYYCVIYFIFISFIFSRIKPKPTILIWTETYLYIGFILILISSLTYRLLLLQSQKIEILPTGKMNLNLKDPYDYFMVALINKISLPVIVLICLLVTVVILLEWNRKVLKEKINKIIYTWKNKEDKAENITSSNRGVDLMHSLSFTIIISMMFLFISVGISDSRATEAKERQDRTTSVIQKWAKHNYNMGLKTVFFNLNLDKKILYTPLIVYLLRILRI